MISNKYDDLKIIIGPSIDEHNFLMKNYKFYFNMYNKKKYSFCSDLYRIWKLSKSEGMYIDANTIIDNERFYEIINLIKKYEYSTKDASIFVKENGHIIWNGFMYSNNQGFFRKILNFYKIFPNISSMLTGPLILSIFLYREFGSKLDINKNNFYLDARDIDHFSSASIIKYNSFGSWGKTKK